TLPPRPPSPPSGPPMGTLDSRRNDTLPDPPLPALTRTTTRSMNTASSSVRNDPVQQPVEPLGHIRGQERRDHVQHVVQFAVSRSGIDGSVQVRMQLSLLHVRRANGHDAQLAPPKVQRGPAKQLAVTLHDHPLFQRRMQAPYVASKPFVEASVHRSARLLAALPPCEHVVVVRTLVFRRRCES